MDMSGEKRTYGNLNQFFDSDIYCKSILRYSIQNRTETLFFLRFVTFCDVFFPLLFYYCAGKRMNKRASSDPISCVYKEWMRIFSKVCPFEDSVKLV